MSVDFYEATCHTVVIWPDSVDGVRHLGHFCESRKIVLQPLQGSICLIVLTGENQSTSRRSIMLLQLITFDLGSEGWYKKTKMASAVCGRLLRRSTRVSVVVFRTINEIIFGNSSLKVQEFGWFQKGHFFSFEPNYRSVIRCGISGANGWLPHVHSQTRRAFPFETDHGPSSTIR
jgi:hypothetical protein